MLDIAIVIIYLVFLTIIGLMGGKDVKSAESFSSGSHRYGMIVLFASLSSSYIGGGYSSGNAAEGFSNGIGMTLALFGFSISMILIGIFLVPGVKDFQSATSVGGVIGQRYGKSAQILTGFFSFLCSAGMIGAQMGAIGMVFHTLFGLSPKIGILIGCSIVFLYSTTGGIQSIIIADTIQFVMLSIGMPVLLFMGLKEAGGIDDVFLKIPPTHLNPLNGFTLLGFISLFFTMMFGEALAPPYTQRLLIGKDPRQTAKATILSGIYSIPFFIITGLIGMTALILNSTTDSAAAMPSLIQQVLPVGIRGVVMAAMVSIILSAADGFLNTASIGLVNDCLLIIKPNISDKKQLWLLRAVNLLTGVGAVMIALVLPNVFSILVFAYSFWSPLILVPLAAALLGVRSNGRAFRGALLAGFLSSLIWNFIFKKPFEIDGAIVGMVFNLIVFTIKTRQFQKYRTETIAVIKVK